MARKEVTTSTTAKTNGNRCLLSKRPRGGFPYPTPAAIWLRLGAALRADIRPSTMYARRSPAERRTARKIVCLCRDSHDGRPAGLAQGCGRWWLVDIVRSGDGSNWHLEPAEDDRMLPAAEALNDAAANQLTDVRNAVEKWLPGVAALYGLFGLAGIVTAPSRVAKLAVGEKWLVAAFILVGLGATITSIICGYRAAYGWPRIVKVMSNEQLQAWYEKRKNRAGKAIALFRTALVCALIALTALLLAAGTLWTWPAP